MMLALARPRAPKLPPPSPTRVTKLPALDGPAVKAEGTMDAPLPDSFWRTLEALRHGKKERL